ncbi:unnamed protein product [Rangifer tarandus platyrhynchus]|uniref:Uncharacterized protein n=2 Tax=Rangifer tarandus platyrhynchus TaxID=3082113 RepID=A0ABN8XX50_RANTA|nr:unnamed protein product [Rangifer tarandus platyrhynchus]
MRETRPARDATRAPGAGSQWERGEGGRPGPEGNGRAPAGRRASPGGRARRGAGAERAGAARCLSEAGRHCREAAAAAATRSWPRVRHHNLVELCIQKAQD